MPRLPGSWVHFPSRAGAGRGRTDDCPKTSVVAFKSLHPQWITGIWSRHHVLKRKRDGRTEGRGLDIRRSGWEGALRGPVGQLNLSFTRLGITRLCLDRCNPDLAVSVSYFKIRKRLSRMSLRLARVLLGWAAGPARVLPAVWFSAPPPFLPPGLERMTLD